MKTMRVRVSFEVDFDYDFEDQEAIDKWDDQAAIDGIFETLADRTNNYWNDAEVEVYEIDEMGERIFASPNNWVTT